jgi:hypothetical protein
VNDNRQSDRVTGPSPNPIVRENEKSGNWPSEWDLSGPASEYIEGFATDISVNHGQTIRFKINTTSTYYRIDIYRLGYYGGLGARKVETIICRLAQPQSQPDPLVDEATGLVDAGVWRESAAWDVPADAISGVYIAKLVREDGEFGENHIPFVVRADELASDIIFQTADTTWHAYNGWGGSNLYGGCGPSMPDGRAYAVSYNRPLVVRDSVGVFSGPQDFVFGVEHAAIRWLEKNGYDVTYIAGVDADRYGPLLLNHKIYMDCGHDEYWSGNQRANVEAAREHGVHLVFMSGNEAYWKTRFEPSIDPSRTAHRSLICYKETRANAKIDPSPSWTGTWRDPRFSPPSDGGRPENALTGTIFAVDSYRSDAITIPYELTKLRFWRNSALAAATQPGQTASLVKNVLGYEWDASPDNGFMPAGLIFLSVTTLSVDTLLLDYGSTTGWGSATHHLTLYRHKSGAIVFGAGTVYWAWGLDPHHDLEKTNEDSNIQQAMVNLLADMDVQPQTLQTDLVPGEKSKDSSAPTSRITGKIVAGQVFATGETVVLEGTAQDEDGHVAGVEITLDGGVTWHRATGTNDWTYSFVAQHPGDYAIASRAVDDSLNLEQPRELVRISARTPADVLAPMS